MENAQHTPTHMDSVSIRARRKLKDQKAPVAECSTSNTPALPHLGRHASTQAPPRRYLPDDRVPQTRRRTSGETTPAAACPFAASARRGRPETAARPLPPLPSNSRRAHRFGHDPGRTLHPLHRPSLHLLVERPWHCWQPAPDRARRTSKYPQPATQGRDHHLPWGSRLRYHGLLGMKNS